jgi:hypothetical protein
MEKINQSCVCFMFHGAFSIETSIEIVESRNHEAIKIPQSCFAFYFFDRTVIKIDGEKDIFDIDEQKNQSGRYFYGGGILTLEEVSKKVPDSSSMQEIMKQQNWKAIRTPFGKYQFFDEKTDILLKR